MSAMQSEVFEAFRAIDVPEDKALKAAAALTSALTRAESETISAFGKRDSSIDAIERDVASTKIDTGTLKSDVTVLKADVATLKADVTVLKADVATLKADVTVLKADVATLKADVTVLKTDVGGLKIDMVTVKGELALHRWMLGFALALLVTILFRVFTH